MPNARFVYCYRDFAEIVVSWSKPTSFVDPRIRTDAAFQRETFDRFLEIARDLQSKAPYFYWLDHREFVAEPKRVMEELSHWIGLAPFAFDVSYVSPEINIKDRLARR